jgi:hypothetical protein
MNVQTVRSWSNNKANTLQMAHITGCREVQQESKDRNIIGLYNESSNKNCIMFPYSKKQEKLLRVFKTFTDITGKNLRFKTNYITQR